MKRVKSLLYTIVIVFLCFPKTVVANDIIYNDSVEDIHIFDNNNILLNSQETNFNQIDLKEIEIQQPTNIHIIMDGRFGSLLEDLNLDTKPVKIIFVHKDNYDYKIGDNPLDMEVELQLTYDNDGWRATIDKNNNFDKVLGFDEISILFTDDNLPMDNDTYIITHQEWGEDGIDYAMDFYPNNIVQGLSLQQITLIILIFSPFVFFFTILLTYYYLNKKNLSKKKSRSNRKNKNSY